MTAFANAMSGALSAMSATPVRPLSQSTNPMAGMADDAAVRLRAGLLADGLHDDVVGRAARGGLADGGGATPP